MARPKITLTDEQVASIRLLLSSGVNQYEIANQFGTSQGTVSRIASGKAYPELPPIPEKPLVTMHCKQALFLSTIGWASRELGEYLIQIEATTEEYKPVFAFTSGPFSRNVYVVYVGRKVDGGYTEPHEKERFYDIETLVAMLQTWEIPLDGWTPDEEEMK